jgi:pyruvate,water dikinase
VYSELIDDSPILTKGQCEQLYREALEAVRNAGMPLDLEWAVDHNGELFWLQARPITTIGSDLNELDTPVNENDVLTRCNVGEMMPGASCPLTFSTTGRCIENGMQHMHVCYAGRPEVNDEWTQIAMSHGKLFINMTGSIAAASTVMGVDAKSAGYSLCGEEVKELKDPPKGFWWTRLLGAIKMVRYIQQADAVIAGFKLKADVFNLTTAGSSTQIAEALENALPFYSEAMEVHLRSSTTSGVASNILQSMISGGQESSPEEQAEAAKLMAGATGVESAVLVEQLDHIIDQIAGDSSQASRFIDACAADALSWLTNGAGKISSDFNNFLQRHGHRGYRELCMREYSWADAPEGLTETIQASVKSRLAGISASERPQPADLNQLNRGLRWILPKAHNAIRRREMTKSLLVDVANRFKRSYRALGKQLVKENKLTEADLVFFFTHPELMEFTQHQAQSPCPENSRYWNHKTQLRRAALEFQDRLEFNEISVGAPEPIDTRTIVSAESDSIVGRPVSSGIVEGLARVAFNVSEAASLEPGEILVAPITDVGWTPYFSSISGLVTDVGSSVSHGAVIAREYGLPAIVNTRTATQQIKTGDKILLDANTGIVSIL